MKSEKLAETAKYLSSAKINGMAGGSVAYRWRKCSLAVSAMASESSWRPAHQWRLKAAWRKHNPIGWPMAARPEAPKRDWLRRRLSPMKCSRRHQRPLKIGVA